MTDQTDSQERYLHGYAEWTRRWMETRTAERELGFLMRHLTPGKSVIDCGCGPGSITVGLAEVVSPGEVLGVDIESRQLEVATAAAAQRGATNVRFEKALDL